MGTNVLRTAADRISCGRRLFKCTNVSGYLKCWTQPRHNVPAKRPLKGAAAASHDVLSGWRLCAVSSSCLTSLPECLVNSVRKRLMSSNCLKEIFVNTFNCHLLEPNNEGVSKTVFKQNALHSVRWQVPYSQCVWNGSVKLVNMKVIGI